MRQAQRRVSNRDSNTLEGCSIKGLVQETLILAAKSCPPFNRLRRFHFPTTLPQRHKNLGGGRVVGKTVGKRQQVFEGLNQN